MLAGLLWSALAWAELPPPDYRAALGASAAVEVARLARQEGLAAAEDFASDWRRQIGPDAGVCYELGLAARLAGDSERAAEHLDDALRIDPKHVASRYDRGELRLNQGDLRAAREDFEAVVVAAPQHWAGHFRLADLAARAGDAVGFEAHLLEALRYGFSLRTVVGDARWHGYARDPSLGPVLRRLITVYQDESVLEALEKPPETNE
jgi:tetratricopeptide (TPR) repeat protein